MQRKSTIKFADDDDDILEEEDRQRRVSVIASRRQSVVIAGSTGVLRRTSMFLSRTSQSGQRSSLQSNESSIPKSSLKSSLKASPRSPAVKAAGVTAATTVVYQKQTSKQSPISKIKKKAPKPITGVKNAAFENASENIVVDEDIDGVIDDVFIDPKPRLTIPSLIEEETSLRSSNRTTNQNTQQEMMVSPGIDDVTRETLEEIHEVGNEDVFESNNVKTLFGIKPGEATSSTSDVIVSSTNQFQPTSQQKNNAFVYPQLDKPFRITDTNKDELTSSENKSAQPTSGGMFDAPDLPRKPSIHGIKLPSIKNSEVPPVAIKTGLLLGSNSKTGDNKTEIEGLQEFQEQLKNGDLPKIQESEFVNEETEVTEQKKERKSKKKKRKKVLPHEDLTEDQESLQNLQNGLESHLQEQPSSLESMKSRKNTAEKSSEKSSRKKKRKKSQKLSSDLQATSSAASISPEDQQRLEEIYNRAVEEQNFENPSEGTV